MKIIAIKLKNFQKVKERVIVLSPNITFLRGRNATGKSTCIRAFQLFSGMFSTQDIKGLKPKDKPEEETKVELLLANLHKLTATISYTYTPTYHYYDDNNNLIAEWIGHTDKINEILGWKVTENGIFLNSKKSKYHLGINTSPTEMAEVVEYICKDTRTEKRIENMEEALKQLKKTKPNIETEQIRALKELEEFGTYDIKKAITKIKELDTESNEISNILSLINLLNNSKVYRSEQEEIQELEDTLNIVKDINGTNEVIQVLTTTKVWSKNIGQLDEINIALSDLEVTTTDQKTTQNLLNSYKEIQNQISNISKISQLNNIITNMESYNLAENLNTQTNNLIDYNKLLNLTKELDTTVRNLHQTKDIINIINSCNQITHLNANLNKIKEISTIDVINKNINNIQKFIYYANNLRVYKSKVELHKKIINFINNINNIVPTIKTVDSLNKGIKYIDSYKDSQSTLKELNAEIENLSKEGLLVECPICNSRLKVEQ